MKNSWSKNVLAIAAIFSFRMLGLFMLIPVFTVFAPQLKDATPALTGFALGSYGLSQGLLQIPFGMLSDRYGRKKLITIGLLLFAFGSLLGALTHSIYGMIFARTLQGTGAIGSVLIALLADLTPEHLRTRAMAIVGVTIGMSFSLAMIISPALTSQFGLSGVFYFTCVLALAGLLLLHIVIPTPVHERFHPESETRPSLLKSVVLNINLQRLNLGIFFQHVILTATFFVVPLLMQQQLQQGHIAVQWHFYLPVMLFSFLLMIPFVVLADRRKQMKPVFLMSVLVICLAQICLFFFHQVWFMLCVLMLVYFAAFNILEASLPALISRQATATSKGTAMGVYSSSQFMGIFFGGTAAGLIFKYFGMSGIFAGNAIISFIWMIIALPMKSG